MTELPSGSEEHVDVNLCATWRLNQFVFENATLREIASCLSVKFNVNVNIESSSLAQRIEGQEVFIWKNKTKKK